ncbi:unnamed protein product [Closterium sp. NIES-54]
MGGTNGMYGVYGMLFLLPPYQAPVPLPAKPAAQPSQSSGSGGAKPSTAAAGKAAAAPAEASSAAAAPAAAPSTTAAPQVLCASNEDHTVCRPLQPPEGAAIGEKITFAGVDGKPEEVLNPKKKLFEKLQPFLRTDGTGVAMFQDTPMMTTAGPCTSTIVNASVK